ncbi:MAG: VWA domain-containing protein [Methylococcaceae bacterium]|nr:VWA domain-containing protein [Methylococcaceae bacterium]MDZ4155750.1 vWA domain-containing protein [Methylococcales bacterium]MDP2391901.1 VWA domain-containing protein [Methylococcaceae bacterium]MDP3018860.1 VWA domain-containing protein [Methylococcaceae bacterium]MDP3391421.1 VWA domain-containing protein [Methylococcaceae bacterium]
MNIKKIVTDYRSIALILALLAMTALFMFPSREQKSPVYNLTFIIDITRSMNATDYQQDDQAVSRLETVKQNLRQLLSKLPCQSKVGLGLFTERRSTLLFEPLEVCSAFGEIDSAINAVDWRMAWAADSNISKGLFSTLEMLQKNNSAIIFISDGQEAPPINPKYQPDFSTVVGKVKGMIVGAGGLQAVPIPKFDANGKQTGFYSAEDVPHRSSFGESNLDPASIEGYNARNAPFGSSATSGTEHLTALQETYLQQLAAQSGLAYTRLSDTDNLYQALQNSQLATSQIAQVDIRWRMASLALLLLTAVYFPASLFVNRRQPLSQ